MSALTLIGILFAVQVAISGTWTRTFEERAQHLYEDSLASIEQVSRIGRDIDRKRILVDNHILESQPAGMARIEGQLLAVASDLQEAEDTYAPLVELPNEETTWDQLQVSMGRFDRGLNDVLALSRENRDAEARTKMTAALDEYSDAHRRTMDLIDLNHTAANEALAQIQRLRRLSLIGIWATGAAALLVLLVFGRLAVHRISSYEEQLIAYSNALEQRNRELDAFAGRLAHDLHTPVTSLLLATELLARTASNEQMTPLARLRRAIARITTMIDDLLTFARADAAAGGPSNPATIAAKIRDDFWEHFAEQATLHDDVESASVAYREGLLRQAVWNLVENGVKYRRGDVHADVGVSGHVVDGRYELRISDNGVGMLAEEVQHVFDPFYRAQRVPDVAGTGLGLSIVKRIVEAGGGKVSAETQLGRGTTFLLELPLV